MTNETGRGFIGPMWAENAPAQAMIRICDGHRGHGETGCGFSTSTWPGGECPMCGGAMVDREVKCLHPQSQAGVCIDCGVEMERRPVCSTCLDTHRMFLGGDVVMCTRCPVPCESCRRGAFCAVTPCACACHSAKAERRPVAGWIKLAPGRYTLDVGMLRLAVYPPRPDREVRGWAVEIDDVEITHGFVPTDAGEIAAQLAAEDALAAVRDEIAAVLR